MLTDRRASGSTPLSRSRDQAAMPQHRQQCYFSGRVQGVGFRYTVKNIALQHNVSGYVRNLPDGRVELVMEGPDDEMTQVMNAVHRRMDAFIKKLDLNTSPATGEFEQFTIKNCTHF